MVEPDIDEVKSRVREDVENFIETVRTDVDPEEFATLGELLGGELMLNPTNGLKEA